MAMGKRPIQDLSKCFIIISEYNRSIQGFLVHSVERIINMNWESILPPPKGAGRINYMTAVTEVDGELVEILDVERILNEISPVSTEVSTELVEASVERNPHGRPVLVADDSSVARKQVQRALEAIGVQCVLAKDGREALNMLLEMSKNGPIHDQIALVISDIEMPEMDGYRLTHEVRSDPRMSDLFITLNTSLSGNFNEAMVKKVGCDRFISKFQPDLLVDVAQQRMRQILGR